jgi:hypothetical protein
VYLEEEFLHIIPDAPDTKLTKIGQILANLCGIHTTDVGQTTGGDNLYPLMV